MAWPRNLYKKPRHVVEVSDAEWKFAAELGRMQQVPVAPHGLLHHAIRLYLAEKARELQVTLPRSTNGRRDVTYPRSN
jgi:hypothetical protein